MGERKPVIGITCGYDNQGTMSFVKEGYYKAITRVGGLAILLPVTDNESVISGYYSICDGIILSGGPDVDACYFGEENMPCAGEISPIRDSMEIKLARLCLDMDKPILGICRGCQVLNIAAGGSIFQDIYQQYQQSESIKAPLKHMQQAPKWYPTHSIRIKKESMLHDIFKQDEIRVNSFHHQAISTTAERFTIAAAAKDGVIEAITNERKTFTVGVQWHPELMFSKYDNQLALFERMIAVC